MNAPHLYRPSLHHLALSVNDITLQQLFVLKIQSETLRILSLQCLKFLVIKMNKIPNIENEMDTNYELQRV